MQESAQAHRACAATCLRGGGIVNDDIVANLLLNLPVKKNLKIGQHWQSYEQDYSGLFFDSRCTEGTV